MKFQINKYFFNDKKAIYSFGLPFSRILRKLDISESDAIRMYYRQIVVNKGIPFELKVPNKETIEALDEIRKAKLREYENFDDYLKDIGVEWE